MRDLCRRCLRPVSSCLCDDLPAVPSRTRIVLLQHPREARLAICSAWLARIALENAELHRGVAFEDHPRVAAVAADPGAALLFPGPGVAPAAARADDPPSFLVVVDGTWHQAEKMLRQSPSIARLPRLAVAPDGGPGYGALRAEPAPECLSTLEAVALALGALERDPARFEPMRAAFRKLVDGQLEKALGQRNPRHRAPRRAGA